MHVDLLFPNRFIKCADLRGKDVTLTICNLNPKEELRRPGGAIDYKPCLYFEETAAKVKKGEEEKRLVINKTNAKSIAKMYGNDTDNWIGCKITLYPTTTRCGAETVDCVRIREQVPQ